MFRAVSHAIDRLAILSALRSPQRGVAGPEETARVATLLDHPDFFSAGITPAAIEFHGRHGIRFPSPLPGPWEENNVVRGRIYRATQDWAKKPAVLLLHGWNGELNYETLFPWMGHRLAGQDMTAVSILLPYHGARKPGAPGAIRNFICDDLGCVLTSTRQSIADCRALIRWLHAQGCPRVGVFGFSFGAWLAGLLACHEPALAFAGLGTPINRIDGALRELAFCRPLKEKLECLKLSVEKFDLAAQKPLLPPHRVLILEALYDLFAPAETAEELWTLWNQPEIWRVPHGHISVLFSPAVMRCVCDWIAFQSGIARQPELPSNVPKPGR